LVLEFDYCLFRLTDDKLNVFGLKDDVLKVKLKVFNIICEELQKSHHLANQICQVHAEEHFQWQYKNESESKWFDFEPITNSQIEIKFKDKSFKVIQNCMSLNLL
jgi:hypothetical protein